MRIDILTIFPQMIEPIYESITGRAIKKKILELFIHDLRDFTTNKHRSVDDTPYGGGPGMVMSAEPFVNCIEHIQADNISNNKGKVIYLSPHGRRLEQKTALELSKEERLILLCGRYEGVDNRIRDHFIDMEISIGDYVLTGGELPAMVLIDTIIRNIKGVLGDDNSSKEESFSWGLLEYPQYTRPNKFKGYTVPDILTSGNHAAINKWRRQKALELTNSIRPDLLKKANLDEDDKIHLNEINTNLRKDIPNVGVILLHHPILGKKNEIITTAVANLNIHDIARCCKTYDLNSYYIVTPEDEQINLVNQMVNHWVNGKGASRNNKRKLALSLVKTSKTLDSAILSLTEEFKSKPIIVATSASQNSNNIDYSSLVNLINKTSKPLILIFGTGWGLTEDTLSKCDYVLLPIKGISKFNHLSVRSAVSITLDRLFGN